MTKSSKKDKETSKQSSKKPKYTIKENAVEQEDHDEQIAAKDELIEEGDEKKYEQGNQEEKAEAQEDEGEIKPYGDGDGELYLQNYEEPVAATKGAASASLSPTDDQTVKSKKSRKKANDSVKDPTVEEINNKEGGEEKNKKGKKGRKKRSSTRTYGKEFEEKAEEAKYGEGAGEGAYGVTDAEVGNEGVFYEAETQKEVYEETPDKVKQPDEDNKEGVNETRKSGRKHRRKYGPLKDKEESPEGGGRYYSADASGEDTATEKRHRRRSKKEGKEGGGQPLYVSGDETQAYGADYTEDAEGHKQSRKHRHRSKKKKRDKTYGEKRRKSKKKKGGYYYAYDADGGHKYKVYYSADEKKKKDDRGKDQSSHSDSSKEVVMYNEYGSEKQPSSHDPDHDKKKDKHKEPEKSLSDDEKTAAKESEGEEEPPSDESDAEVGEKDNQKSLSPDVTEDTYAPASSDKKKKAKEKDIAIDTTLESGGSGSNGRPGSGKEKPKPHLSSESLDMTMEADHRNCIRIKHWESPAVNRQIRYNFGFNHPPNNRPFFPKSFTQLLKDKLQQDKTQKQKEKEEKERQLMHSSLSTMNTSASSASSNNTNKSKEPKQDEFKEPKQKKFEIGQIAKCEAMQYIYCKNEVAQVKVMKRSKLLYIRDLQHCVTMYTFEDGFYARLSTQKFDYCGSLEVIEYHESQRKDSEVLITTECHVTKLLQVQILSEELQGDTCLDTSTLAQKKPWELAARDELVIVNVTHEKEIHVFRNKRYAHRILFGFPDSLSQLVLTPDGLLLCMMKMKLTVYEWDMFRSRDYKEHLRMANSWIRFIYFEDKHLIMAPLYGQENIMQFLHIVPGTKNNFVQSTTGSMMLKFPCVPLCALGGNDFIVSNIGRRDVLTIMRLVIV
ncbi:uncharacterized protein LOC142352838 isoform X2 [Convolutriloba macropyga]|uniref:uncharacterized protein LOC142352838 isoform X2 n=1 Tax=Convolutriloba macropyga TaxID=536237 RepID=UPI003F522780